MKDSIYIKAINQKLEWNSSLVSIMDLCSYQIDYLNNKVSIYISRGYLNDSIEFMRAKIAELSIGDLASNYFTNMTLECLSPREKVEDFINNNTNENIEFEVNGNILMIRYCGDNLKQNLDSKTNNKLPISDFEKIDNWRFDIPQVRHLLKHESHERHYDYNYQKETRYCWLHFNDLSIFGLRNLDFSGYYSPDSKTMLSLSARIGSSNEDYEVIKNQIIRIHNNPTETKPIKYDDYFKTNIRSDKWITDGFEITLGSTLIPRADVMTYELKINNYSA